MSMMILGAGSIVVVIFACLAAIQVQALKKKLAERDEQYEVVKRDRKHLSEMIQQLQKKESDHHSEHVRITKELNKITHQLDAAEERVVSEEAKRREVESSTQSWRNQIDNLKEQNEVLTKQLVEIDQGKRALREELGQKERALRSELVKDEEGKKRQIADLNRRIKDLEVELQKKDKAIAAAKENAGDPEQVRTLQRRVNQYDQFCRTMRQQKEMLEERNANWETALRMLAGWVYRQLAPQRPVPSSLGEAVGTALELTGNPTLVRDQEDLASRRQLSSEDEMRAGAALT